MKLAIFDKDGTLVEPVSGQTFVQHPEDQQLLPGVAEGLAAMDADGYTLAIASNQGGVASGHKTLEDCVAEMFYCMKITEIPRALAAHSYEEDGGAVLSFDLHEIAPHWGELTKAKRKFRKPASGMIDAIASRVLGHRLWHSAFEEILFVGDRPEDEQAAAAAGVKFMWADAWRSQNLGISAAAAKPGSPRSPQPAERS